MPHLKFKRFTRPQVLQRLGRPLLLTFLAQFDNELRQANLRVPSPSLPEREWYGAVARLLAAPEDLPEEMNEALFAIDEMASPEGQEQLEDVIARAGLAHVVAPDLTREELALHLWLAAPALLARAHNEQRLRRLSAFDFFGTPVPAERRAAFAPPTAAQLAGLAAELDPWFARHQRGRNTTRLELYPLNGEYWFLVRHGDTFSRAPKVEAQQTEVLHFRPERDDVVVYSPERDEIRINARTRGERELYVGKFGLCLRGRADYFSEAGLYTLEPLRSEGPAALDCTGVEGIRQVILREVQIAWDDPCGTVVTRFADDLFGCALQDPGASGPIPRHGRLIRAAFDFYFTDSRAPRLVQVRVPNRLKLGRHCDAWRVDRWLSRRGFRLR